MPVKRMTINLAVNGNALTAMDAATGQTATDAGIQGEDGAVWLHLSLPDDWKDLTARLQVLAVTGAYDESDTPENGVIDMPLRQGVTVPGPLTVSLLGGGDGGIRRTAELKTLTVRPAAVPANAIGDLLPIDFEALKGVVDTQVVHTVTGSGGALVTRTGATTVNIDVTGTGGDMLQANYANGAGQANPNRVDRALYAENADAAASGSALEKALAAKQAALSTGGGGEDVLYGTVVKSLKCAGLVSLSSDGNSVTVAARDFPGVIKPYAGAAAPAGTLLCDGSAVSRTAYAGLFAAIGTAWGAGDGSTTFNLPDLGGKTLVGLDASQTEFSALAKTGGEKVHLLTTEEMPAHDHNIRGGSNSLGLAVVNGSYPDDPQRFGFSDATLASNLPEFSAVSTGGGGAHNNLQPYAVVNYIIVY